MSECSPLDECRAIILTASSILYGNIQNTPCLIEIFNTCSNTVKLYVLMCLQSTSIRLNWSP